jgi:hypothetical protein
MLATLEGRAFAFALVSPSDDAPDPPAPLQPVRIRVFRPCFLSIRPILLPLSLAVFRADGRLAGCAVRIAVWTAVPIEEIGQIRGGFEEGQ